MQIALNILLIIALFIAGYILFRLILWVMVKKINKNRLTTVKVSFIACLLNMPVMFVAGGHGFLILPVPSYVAVYLYYGTNNLPAYFVAALLSSLVCVPIVNKKLKYTQMKENKI